MKTFIALSTLAFVAAAQFATCDEPPANVGTNIDAVAVAKAAAEYRAEHPEAAASPASGGEGDGGDGGDEPESLNFLRSPRRIK